MSFKYVLSLALCAAALAAEAQQARLYRVGVVLHGGQYSPAIDGLRGGFKELGLVEGQQFVLHVRETGGELKSVAAAAKSLEGEQVDLIYSITTSVTLAAKRATKSVPIVFYAGADPVAIGLVESFRKPGGRLTGNYSRFTDLAPKRLQLLKEMIPRLRRVVTFYNPENPTAQRTAKIVGEAARQLKVELVERQVASVDELRASLRALRPGEVDAFIYWDAMVGSQAELIIETARAIKLPTIYNETGSVARGGLAAYGASFYAIGRLSARQIQRVLQGAKAGDLPIESVDRLHLVINLKTAKALGLTIPASVLARADEVIE